jgi:hypothetical protein
MDKEKVGGSSNHIYAELILKLSSGYAYISQASLSLKFLD